MQILCRFDPAQEKPVVFITDTINGNKIQAWKGEGNPEYVPLDYYAMTRPLSAADERVLMERYKAATGKQDQVIQIRQRLPRNNRPLPNLLAGHSTPPSVLKSEAPKPAATATPAAAAPVQNAALAPAPAPVPVPPSALSSAAILEQVREESARLNQLTQLVAQLSQQLEQASADFTKSKDSYSVLTAQYESAIERETAEELQKRREALTMVTQAGPVDVVAKFAQDLQDAGAQPVAQATATTSHPAATPAPAPATKAAATKKAASKGKGKVAPNGRGKGGSRKPAAKPV